MFGKLFKKKIEPKKPLYGPECFTDHPYCSRESPLKISALIAIDEAKHYTAGRRALEFLRENLSESQNKTLSKEGYIDVVGGITAIPYRVYFGYTYNVMALLPYDKKRTALCFAPEGGLPYGDVVLAQKMALELREKEAIATANFNDIVSKSKLLSGQHERPSGDLSNARDHFDDLLAILDRARIEERQTRLRLLEERHRLMEQMTAPLAQRENRIARAREMLREYERARMAQASRPRVISHGRATPFVRMDWDT